MYLLILIFNFFYIATSGIVFYYKKSDYDLRGRYDIQYTFYTIFYFGEKVTFELVNWIFAYKYWCVSLTLRQALSDNEMKFSEKFQKWVAPKLGGFRGHLTPQCDHWGHATTKFP